MRYLIVGDPHFRKDNLPVMKDICSEIIEKVTKKKYDKLICLGDVLHTHNVIDVHCLDLAVNFFVELSKILHTIIIIGNHDRPNNSDFLSDLHPFAALKGKDNITVVDKVVRLDESIYVPYVPPGRFKEALATIDYDPENSDNHPEFIFSHQEFKGVHMGAIVSEDGDEWNEEYPLIISGHIHDYQILNGNIVYVGTPYQTTFSESENKSLMELDTEKRKLTRCSLKRIPKFKTVRVTAKTLAKLDQKLEKLSGYNVKVVIKVDSLDLDKLRQCPEYKSLFDKVKKIELKVESKELSKAEQYVKDNSGKSLEDILFKLLEGDKECLAMVKVLLGQV